MSIDFTFVLAGPVSDLVTFVSGTATRLAALGFGAGPEVYRVSFDPVRGVFDETGNDEAIVPSDFAPPSLQELSGWDGAACEFTLTGLTLYVLAAHHRDGYLNCFVDITDRMLKRLVEERRLETYLAGVCAIATEMRASGGFAQFAQPFQPVPPQQIIEAIFANPTDGNPSLMGLVPLMTWPDVHPRVVASGRFRCLTSLQGFVLLLLDEFTEADYLLGD